VKEIDISKPFYFHFSLAMLKFDFLVTVGVTITAISIQYIQR